MKYAVALVALLICFQAGYGQDIRDTLNVITNTKVVLTDAKKMELEPVIDVPQMPAPTFTYNLKAKQLLFDPYIPFSRPLNIGSPGLSKIHPYFLKFGYGNYASPLFEFYGHTLRAKKYGAGFSMKHISASGKPDFSNFSQNAVMTKASRYLKKGTLFATADYSRNVVHFYGYDHETYAFSKDSTRQRYQVIEGSAGYENNPKDSNSLGFSPVFKYYHLGTNRKVTEDAFMGSFSASKRVAGNLLQVKLTADHSIYKPDSGNLTRTFVSLAPTYRLKNANWMLDVGLNATWYNDTAEDRMYVFPQVEFNYKLDSNHTVSAGMTGDYRKNSYRSLSEENPFLLDNVLLKNTINQFELHAGIKGKLSNSISYFAGVKYGYVQNLHFFVNNDSDVLRRFNVIYEDNIAKLTNFHLEINYHLAEKIKLSATGNIYKYTLPSLDAAWQRPAADLKISGQYNLGNKIYVNTDIFVIGNRVAMERSPVNHAKLKPIADFNLGINYHYSKVIGVFLNGNNLSSARYQRWYNYPVYGLNLTGGLNLSF